MQRDRAVIFDIGGVLLRLGIKEYVAELKSELGSEEFERYYKEYAPQVDRGEVREVEVWQRIAGRPVPEDAFDEVFERHFPPIPEMLDFARSLRESGVRTAILSNTVPSHVRVMRRMGFLEEFDPVALSCEIGSRKPEPQAIERVIRLLQLPPEQIAYIDDVQEYVEMGRAAGVRAIWHQGDIAATQQAVLDWLGR